MFPCQFFPDAVPFKFMEQKGLPRNLESSARISRGKLLISQRICKQNFLLDLTRFSSSILFLAFFLFHDKFSTINSLTLITHTSHFTHSQCRIYAENVLLLSKDIQFAYMLPSGCNVLGKISPHSATKQKIYWNFMQISTLLRGLVVWSENIKLQHSTWCRKTLANKEGFLQWLPRPGQISSIRK